MKQGQSDVYEGVHQVHSAALTAQWVVVRVLGSRQFGLEDVNYP